MRRCEVSAPIYYPILLKIKGKRCLVVGGGEVAERKVKGILACGGKVKVISPDLTKGLMELSKKGEIDWQKGYLPASSSDLDRELNGVFLIIAATNDQYINKRLAEEARRRGILVNVVDNEDASSFILPSILRRGDLILTVSTSGKSPALARKIREELERDYGEEYSRLLEIVHKVREELINRHKHLPYERWRELLNEELLKLIRQGKEEEAYQKLLSQAI